MKENTNWKIKTISGELIKEVTCDFHNAVVEMFRLTNDPESPHVEVGLTKENSIVFVHTLKNQSKKVITNKQLTLWEQLT